ncbi:hypothetical protein SLS53_008769 [Cytospora paraplurivora]|uniref:Swi5-domain-containing protein n=1 Tax=Cytospora paraplurivora TaxID=2898453 RepID=A0AAN9TXF6_9PEZI
MCPRAYTAVSRQQYESASGELEGDIPLENGRQGLTLLSAADIDFIEGFRNTFEISGPCANDHFEVVVSNAGKAVQTAQYVAGVDAAFQRLKDIRGRCLQLVQKQQELDHEQNSLRQTAETTVNDHIRLLRQYNKMKDVGQQLIGLIAENRGVPIGSLYVDREYGVGPDD